MQALSGLGWPLLGVVLLFLAACGACFFLGSHVRRVRLENQGHEEIEKHLMRQADQLVETEKKFHRLRTRTGLTPGPRVSKSVSPVKDPKATKA